MYESINKIKKLTEKDFISETEFLDKFFIFFKRVLNIKMIHIFSNYL